MNTKKETELPVASSTAEIAHIRAINAAGKSVIATPKQLREMVGIDYSLLTEQEVPGEFALNGLMEKSQVYSKTFIVEIATSTSTYTILGLTLPENGRVVDAFGATLYRPDAKLWRSLPSNCVERYTSSTNSYGIVHATLDVPVGTRLWITVKYVK